ncbi:MAG: hypothetical protein ACRDOA_00500 [Streptosporangiaceae bacterium]
MTTPQTTAGQADGTVPVACTLTSPDLVAQAGRWERLMAGAMTGCTQTSGGLRMSFRSDPEVEEELRRLVATENGCCSWAAWTVETAAGALVLDVRSTGPGVATLHSMFSSAAAPASGG